jgi:hypothetical protein
LPQAQWRGDRITHAPGDQVEHRVGGIELQATRGIELDVPQVAFDLLADDRAARIAQQGKALQGCP